MSTLKKLLFVDANIWLDFYRARNDAGLQLLKHLELVSSSIIVTYQLEMEFKKNRQTAILEGIQGLKGPQGIPRPGLLSDAKEVQAIQKNLDRAESRVNVLKERLSKALENPTSKDPVYKVAQRIFHKKDELVLRRDSRSRFQIRRKAFKRFLLGYPPRKKGDTSMGDAFNWEWMIDCALNNSAELVIASRDSDYGVSFGNKQFINDHLKQEFSERVSRKREILLYSRLSEALKHFSVSITPEEEEAETEIIQNKPQSVVDEAKENLDPSLHGTSARKTNI